MVKGVRKPARTQKSEGQESQLSDDLADEFSSGQ
jgi:hypothetical protein